MNKEEFITYYCKNSGLARKEFDRRLIAWPCSCDAPECRGWQVKVRRNPERRKLKVPDAAA